ncbi:peptidoglycan-binding protein [Clostridium tagluense]|uniref:peptidoglycan-binding protein n=1 Tax=Clostridium tagluense TaxID=360422 RepID=UPI001C0B4F14|nr:peptidoglycan-binding protein [Clostridium tagluense]MBU3130432.1 peptidoglycan-binding protein [Clostridium tagluense]MCB2313219.1 peptidoglycan-binding protein [Clostridium tagluense]MCB2318030.1 peptidoglycan-binding protein [Clostridium tagluense]MCB2322770.1 peptidoglycan-binding protein [Clostridium tagluense]MCB2327814.1 peptidoglycan-binding protein [Clostridium tagluense]
MLLKKGSKGEEVKDLQRKLISLGYSCGNSGADGDFGTGTYNAVIKFQADHQLDKDGIVGPATMAVLNSSTSGSGSGQTFVATFYTNENNAMEGGDSVAWSGLPAHVLKGKDITSVRYIAVDTSVISLGSTVSIDFGAVRYQKSANGSSIDLNGNYRAVDVGGGIRGNHIDVFIGGAGYYHNLANNIGRVNVTLKK